MVLCMFTDLARSGLVVMTYLISADSQPYSLEARKQPLSKATDTLVHVVGLSRIAWYNFAVE